MENNNKGIFITFEGVDGCGKTTQINKLNEYLKEKNYKTVVTLEPGGTEIGKNLRQILLHHKGYVANGTELFLYLADRAQHTQEIVIKNINEGCIVLCDRSIDSTVAYQGYARGIGMDNVLKANSFALDKLPDLTIFIDVTPDVALKRLSGRDKADRLDLEAMDFHQKVYEGYHKVLEMYPDRVVRIDGNKPLEEVTKDCIKVILDYLKIS